MSVGREAGAKTDQLGQTGQIAPIGQREQGIQDNQGSQEGQGNQENLDGRTDETADSARKLNLPANGSGHPPASGLANRPVSALTDDLPAGSFGRRYRPVADGRLANASERVKHMTDEEKIAKLNQLKKSAEEYEGLLLTEMIKSMRQSPFVKTPGGDTYSEIAEKPFTAAITAAGGLGLSQTIVNQVAAQEGLDDLLAARPEVMGPGWRQRLAPSQMLKPGPRAGTKSGSS
jgi:Rod binding domain-containing protein